MVEQHAMIYLADDDTSPQPGHVTNVYGFVSAALSLLTIEFRIH